MSLVRWMVLVTVVTLAAVLVLMLLMPKTEPMKSKAMMGAPELPCLRARVLIIEAQIITNDHSALSDDAQMWVGRLCAAEYEKLGYAR